MMVTSSDGVDAWLRAWGPTSIISSVLLTVGLGVVSLSWLRRLRSAAAI